MNELLDEVMDLPLFRGMGRRQAGSALAVLIPCELEAGELLIREGERDRSLVVVLEGELVVSRGPSDIPLAQVGRGEMLGEMSLLRPGTRRVASVRTVTACRLLVLDASGLRVLRRDEHPVVERLEALAMRSLAARLRFVDMLIASVSEGRPPPTPPRSGPFARLVAHFGLRRDLPVTDPPDPRRVLAASPLLSGASAESIASLAGHMHALPASTGQHLVREGQVGPGIHVVAEGSVDVWCRASQDARAEHLAILEPGSFFGQVSVVDGHACSATCIAAEPTWLLRLPASSFSSPGFRRSLAMRALRRATLRSLASQLDRADGHLEALLTRPARLQPDGPPTGEQPLA